MRAILARASLAVAAAAGTAVAASACFSADVARCAATCSTNADCPAGLVCTGAGRCAETASTACGGGPDAPDAATDAAGDTLTVTVRDDAGLPATGVRVVVSDAAGASIADTTTGTDGTAIVAAPGTVNVTVVRSSATGASLSTILDAAAGDALVFGPERNEAPSVTRDIGWPTHPSAFRYYGWSSCTTVGFNVAAEGGGTSQEAPMTVDATCADDRDVLVSWADEFNVMPRHYLLAVDQPDSNVELDGAWMPFATQRTNLQQLPTGAPVDAYYVVSTVVFRAGEPARGPQAIATPVTGAGGASADLALPPVGDGREMIVLLAHPDDALRVLQITERIPALGEYNLAVEPAMLPWIAGDPTVDATARTIEWPEADAGPTAGDGVLFAAAMEYQRGAAFYEWRIAGPIAAITDTTVPDQRRIVLPDLPGDEPFELRAGDMLWASWVRRYAFDAGVPYAHLRLRAGAAIAGSANPHEVRDRFFADPSITRVVASRYRY